MKKVLALAIFAIAVLGTSVYAAPCLANGEKVFCQWGAAACWQVNSTGQDSDGKPTQSTCETQAGYCPALYSGGKEGTSSCADLGNTPFTCSGCTWAEEGGLVWCDYGPKVGETGGCYQKTAEECTATSGTAVSSESDCGNTPTSKGPFCYWAKTEYNDECYCGVVKGEAATAANCTDDTGEIVTSCDGKCSSAPPVTPILKFPASQALIVAPYGRSLHISSIREATISLYDMSGVKVYSGRVRAGNSVFGLEKVASGSYYAIIQAGSESKKIPVILK